MSSLGGPVNEDSKPRAARVLVVAPHRSMRDVQTALCPSTGSTGSVSFLARRAARTSPAPDSRPDTEAFPSITHRIQRLAHLFGQSLVGRRAD
jgi:hypothetical protein